MSIAGCGTAANPATVTVTRTVPASAPAVAAPEIASALTNRRKPRKVWKNCDTNIKARTGTTSCPFAENVFYGFWRALEQGDDSFRAYSPVTHRRYAMTCAAGLTVTCRAGDGGAVRFSRTSVEVYTDKQAEAFCRSRTVTPTEDSCGAPAGSGPSDQTYSSPDSASPSGTADSYDSTPPVDESDYSDHDGTYNSAPTTEDFGNGQGSVGQCADGTYSDSVGRPGACSHHGGVS